VVMRRISSELPVLSELGLPDSLLTQWVQRARGLLLITGPTGMGKSTTIAGLLQWLNQNAASHVVTIEDPVEFIYTNESCMFTQRDVGHDTPNYARGVRAAMRQSPDIIMIGEVRDPETAAAALQASETGHLVLASIHSDSAVDALERLRHLFPAEQGFYPQLAQQLIGVLCQKLVPRLDGGVQLLVEHFENAGAVREWISQGQLGQLRQFLRRADDPRSLSFLTSVVQAYEAGWISELDAILACGNEAEFRRAARGIS
jgi:pilus retraction protein PilT